MKRLAVSLIVGFLFPFVYTAIVGPLTVGLENPTARRLLDFPVRWPIHLLFSLVPVSAFFENEYGVFAYIIVCDVLLYSFLTYVALSLLLKSKSKRPQPPPEPPQFASQ